MQRLSGLLLMLAAAGLGAYAYLPPPPDGEQRLAEVTRISAAPDRDLRKQAGSDQVAAIAASSTIISKAHAADAVAYAIAVPAETAVTTGALSVAQQTGGWSTVVTTEAPGNGRLTSSKPGDVETRAQLARDLQRELKRVGCYGGEITGNWTPSTQRAMSTFMDRVNATLPVDEPDYILLTLVQGHAAAACGAVCPSGQVLSDGGRCVPHAVVAQATRKSEREQQKIAAARKAAEEQRLAEEQRSRDTAERKGAEDRKLADARDADSKAAAARKAEEQRVAEVQRGRDAERKAAEDRKLADARDADIKAAAIRKAQGAKRVTIAATTPEELPWLNGAQQAPGPGAKALPLPGMMSVGGPRVAAAEPPSEAAATQTELTPPSSAVPATAIPQSQPSAQPSAAPVIVQPEPARNGKPQAKPSSAGLPGSKSGVSVRRSAVRAEQAPAPAVSRPSRPRAAASVRRSAPSVAYRPAPKPKFTYYASSGPTHPRRYYTPRVGASHYNMMQAYSGMY